MVPVQFDDELLAIPRTVRLSSPAAPVSDTVRIRMAGVELEAIIVLVDGPVLRVRSGRNVK